MKQGDERLTCPHCGNEDSRLHYKKLDNTDPLRNLDVYRCVECGHVFSPVPKNLIPAYHASVLGIRLIVQEWRLWPIMAGLRRFLSGRAIYRGQKWASGYRCTATRRDRRPGGIEQATQVSLRGT